MWWASFRLLLVGVESEVVFVVRRGSHRSIGPHQATTKKEERTQQGRNCHLSFSFYLWVAICVCARCRSLARSLPLLRSACLGMLLTTLMHASSIYPVPSVQREVVAAQLHRLDELGARHLLARVRRPLEVHLLCARETKNIHTNKP